MATVIYLNVVCFHGGDEKKQVYSCYVPVFFIVEHGFRGQLFLALLICALISVLLKTDSVWVYVLVGGPVTVMFAVGWAFRHQAFVNAFLSGE